MIHTVTFNPALDLTYRVSELKFDDKLRTTDVFRSPGGGGVNVSRVAARLGHPTVAMGLVGGRAGDEFVELLKEERVRTWFMHQAGSTRTNVVIQDDQARQVRVSGLGPQATEDEATMVHSSIFELHAPDFLVLSGSLQPGMSADFFLGVIDEAKARGIRVVADIDKELKEAVEAGVFLVKPNEHELQRLTGEHVAGPDSAVDAAQRLLELGVGAVLASLGAQGAVLVTRDGSWRATAPEIEVNSVVGAGDSLLAGVLVALAEGKTWEEALQLGIACGTATATTPGTEVCTKEMVEALLPRTTVEKL
jgi:6-phosphofructokinase 2